jgi:hypothetical protein
VREVFLGARGFSWDYNILIIWDELQSIDNAKHLNTHGLKSLITDNEINS